MTKDSYIEDVVKTGDEGSAFLAAALAPTLRNSELIDVLSTGMHGIAVARIPPDQDVVVHTAGADPQERDPEAYAASLVERLVRQALAIGAKPLAFADIIDAASAERQLLNPLASGLLAAANHYHVAVLNGELAVLGSRVRDANLSGVMISLLPGRKYREPRPLQVFNGKCSYITFKHAGRAVFMNADGVGTKTEFYERSGRYEDSVLDFLAMNLDDASKRAAQAVVAAGLVETRGIVPFGLIKAAGEHYAGSAGVTGLFSQEDVRARIRSYGDSLPAFNLSGAVVSLIDEERLANPPVPSAGEFLVAIRGRPNPRSNGITDKRRIMTEWLGQKWHTTPQGQHYLEYLSAPSTLLYPVFRNLLVAGLATGVYHMSGGAYKSKLAAPLARAGLHVDISDMFEPDPRERYLAERAGFSAEAAYQKWPMGTDGFVATSAPIGAIKSIESHGLEARVVGTLERDSGETGVTLHTPYGEKVVYRD